MRILRNLFFTLTLFAPLQLLAWGAQGHRIAGLIAEHYLSTKARAAVRAILGDSSLALAGTWADQVRRNRNFAFLSPWHYIDLDQSYSYSGLRAYLAQDTSIDAYTRLQVLVTELKRPALAREKQLFDLRMLIHLVEDLHQPMHTGHTFDKGGNGVRLIWLGRNSNLHQVWDSGLIRMQHMNDASYARAIDNSTPALRAEWQRAPVSQWIYESNRIAARLYQEVRDGAAPDPSQYRESHIAVLNAQLLKAGVRLAGILNELFG